MTDQEFLTVEDVAKRLKVSVETVRRWLRARELTAFRFGRRGDYRIDPRDLDAFIEARKAAV